MVIHLQSIKKLAEYIAIIDKLHSPCMETAASRRVCHLEFVNESLDK